MKRGVTLLELIVAMGIFAVITTLAIGAYVTVSQMKALTASTREAQQKLRMAQELITRLARQSNTILVPTDKTLELYFDTATNPTAAKFVLKSEGGPTSWHNLEFYDGCSGLTIANPYCAADSWSNPQKILGDNIKLRSASSFTKIATNGLPELNIKLDGRYGVNFTNPYFVNDFIVTTSVILENLK